MRGEHILVVRSEILSVRDYIFRFQAHGAKCDYGCQLQNHLRSGVIAETCHSDLKEVFNQTTKKFQQMRNTCEHY